jgi:hypothetical protein
LALVDDEVSAPNRNPPAAEDELDRTDLEVPIARADAAE